CRPPWLMPGLVAAATAAVVAVPTLVLRDHRTAGIGLGNPPVKVNRDAMNILLVGTDSLAGTERFREGARSDTMLLVHLPADRANITAVNLPRDSMVQIAACGSRPAYRDMLNQAYNMGGMDCAVKTVESLTRVRVDHTIDLDFTSVEEVVNALGGVEVTVPEPVDDRASKLKLERGTHVLDGEKALAWIRLRHYGDGSDISRIKRQQQVMMSMLKKARTLLDDQDELQGLLDTVKKSVKTDKGFDLDTMAGIAVGLTQSKVTFFTVPWQPDPQDKNRLVWRQPEADKLFARFR
ncbi:LCP family protein, partial [Nonomuraea rhizosphaerae]|uniref:LCP family protein n=1 Tax=Nonomuraea rhizosphaerae TaxID=2665663 RepID=UPI001C6010D2